MQYFIGSTQTYRRDILDKIGRGYVLVELILDENEHPASARFLDSNDLADHIMGTEVAGKYTSEVDLNFGSDALEIFSRIVRTGTDEKHEMPADAHGRFYRLHAFKVGAEHERRVAVLYEDISDQKFGVSHQDLLTRLSDISHTLVGPIAIEEKMMQAARLHFNADRCFYCEVTDRNITICTDARRQDLLSLTGKYSLAQTTFFKQLKDLESLCIVDDIYAAVNIDPELCSRWGVVSFISVPIVNDGKITGIFCLAQTIPREWKLIEVDLVKKVAEMVSSAINKATKDTVLCQATKEEDQRELKELQQLELIKISLSTLEIERHRIAESLHNGLGQLLYGIKISLALLDPQQAEVDFLKTRDHTNRLLTDAINESRRISHDLMPATLEDFGLRSAVLDICEQFTGNVCFDCKVDIAGKRLDKYLELAIYRTIQELATNIIKHAQAKKAFVRVFIDQTMISIEVEDDGIGIDTKKNDRPGIGLTTIRSKVRLLNGDIKIKSETNEGTIININIPRSDVENIKLFT